MFLTFEDLDVYKKAYAKSLIVHRLSLKFPKNEQFGLADQIRRSSKSICANIAEGFGKQNYSTLEFKRYIATSLGSSNETIVWINYCFDLSYIDEEVKIKLKKNYEIISKMLFSFLKSLK